MKRKLISMMLALALVGVSLVGCSSSSDTAADSSTSDTSDATDSSDASGELREISLLWISNSSTNGIDAVCAAAEEQLGIKVNIEYVSGGEEGDNVIKTRLATGDMADVCVYNCGSLLSALNPSEYFEDITDEFSDSLDGSFVTAASVDDVLYGIPAYSTQAAVVLYNIDTYEEYGLEIPTTWDEFLANCQVLQDAGEVAIIGSDGDSWTSQVLYLGDHYNVVADEPDFVEGFEEGTVKYATSEAGLGSFEKMEDIISYLNEDHMVTTYDDACAMLMDGEGTQWIMLSSALTNMYEYYGDEVNNIGCFAIPDDDAADTGITVWQPEAMYLNKDSEMTETALEFMEFYISTEGLDIYTEQILPNGPYAVLGYELPDTCYTAVQMMQDYFDNGATQGALEFETSVKGASCDAICQELMSGQTSAAEAAAKYDEDCKLQAIQLGLDWE